MNWPPICFLSLGVFASADGEDEHILGCWGLAGKRGMIIWG